MKKNRFYLALLLTLISVFCAAAPLMAEDKTWVATADAADWSAANNWTPALAPTAADDVLINSDSASTLLSRTFNVKSLTLAGNAPSILKVEEFTSGNIVPASTLDIAVLNRKDGHLILQGAGGTVVLKGSYKDSEKDITPQPSLVVWVG